MANQWLRLWHDMPSDPKFRTIAKVSGEHISLVISVYLNLLVDASRSVTRGHVTVTQEDVASALDVTEAQVEKIISAMEGRVLENGYLSGWSKRQPKREDDGDEQTGAKSAAERKREQRRREKEHLGNQKKHDVLEGKTCGHDASRNVTTDTDTDTDTDKDKEENKHNNISDLEKKGEQEKKDVVVNPNPMPNRTPTQTQTQTQTRAVEIAVMLRQRGAAVQASNPYLLEWAERGISDAQLLTALEQAQSQRHEQNNPNPVNAGYLNAILRNATKNPFGKARTKSGYQSVHERREATARMLYGSLQSMTQPREVLDDGRTIEHE